MAGAKICFVTTFLCLWATGINSLSIKQESTHFRAASYEHVAVSRVGSTRAPDDVYAKYIITQNLKVYQEQAELASLQGADILVFPEYGVFGLGFTTRESIHPFLEEIPNPDEVTWNPCLDAEIITDVLAQFSLSCMALEHNMYIVANVGDKIACSPQVDENCPDDGWYQYNTNVVFNPEGILVSRYHKQTLFYEDYYDTPLQIEHSTFDTPFGKFGSFVCFDVLFEEPAIALVEDHLVDHVAFPTAWSSKLPLMQGIAYHESWSVRNGVSFLTSELHYPEDGFAGSTLVAAADGSVEYYFNSTVESEGQLIIADIPITPSKPVSQPIGELPSETEGLDLFNAQLQGDVYTFVTLDSEEGNITVYTGDTKCNVAYRFSQRCQSDLYAVGVFDGLHDSAFDSYIQVCTLVRCSIAWDRYSCGRPTMAACSTFDYIELVSETSSDYIYPQMVLDTGVVDKTQWSYVMDSEGNHRARLSSTPTSAVVTAALYGRDHSRDSSLRRRQQPVPHPVHDVYQYLDNRSSGLSAKVNVLLIVTMSMLVMGVLFAVNRLPIKNGLKINENHTM